jgi:hypothetical protein
MVTFRRTALLGFDTFQMGLLSTFRMTLFAFDDFDPTVSNNFAYTIITFIIFIFVVSILLLNMLIAMMGDTYARVRESSEMQHTLEWVSIVLLLERRLPFFLRTRYRSGIPSPEIGLDGKDYYLIVEERTDWGETAANRRLRFIFKNAIKKVISALRMRRMLSADPSKRQQVLEQQQKLLEEEERRLKEKLDQRIRKRVWSLFHSFLPKQAFCLLCFPSLFFYFISLLTSQIPNLPLSSLSLAFCRNRTWLLGSPAWSRGCSARWGRLPRRCPSSATRTTRTSEEP